MLNKLKVWAKNLKHYLYALYLAYHHQNVPLIAKIVAVIVVSYALSPIDLIPDFIPIIGYIDDLILLPLGIDQSTLYRTKSFNFTNHYSYFILNIRNFY